jgi:hypothetical protein
MTDRHDHTPAGGPANRDMASGEWLPCAEGELRRMVARHRNAGLNRTLAMGVAAGAVCIALMGGWVLISQRGQNATSGSNFADITCDSVHAQLSQYVDGTLDEATSQRIGEHLRLCPKCGQIYEQMTGQRVAFNQHSCADPTCRYCRPPQRCPPQRCPPQQPHVLLAGQPGRTTVALVMK